MAGIHLNQNQRTLTEDALSELGVIIEDMELRCIRCGNSFSLTYASDDGNFEEDWFKCDNLKCENNNVIKRR